MVLTRRSTRLAAQTPSTPKRKRRPRVRYSPPSELRQRSKSRRKSNWRPLKMSCLEIRTESLNSEFSGSCRLLEVSIDDHQRKLSNASADIESLRGGESFLSMETLSRRVYRVFSPRSKCKGNYREGVHPSGGMLGSSPASLLGTLGDNLGVPKCRRRKEKHSRERPSTSSKNPPSKKENEKERPTPRRSRSVSMRSTLIEVSSEEHENRKSPCDVTRRTRSSSHAPLTRSIRKLF